MRISSLILIVSSVLTLVSATPANHAMIARHAEEAREVTGEETPSWKREAEPKAGTQTADWRRKPSRRRAPEAAPSPPNW